MSKPKRIAIYTWVSTDCQSVENQRRELLAVAGRRRWEVVQDYSAHGISGAMDRDKRPAFDRMLKEALAKGDRGILKIAAEFGVGSRTVQGSRLGLSQRRRRGPNSHHRKVERRKRAASTSRRRLRTQLHVRGASVANADAGVQAIANSAATPAR